jgi:serine phosphatase RsbU (regulator of sigma subunit)
MPLSELGKLAVDAGAKVLQDGFMVTRQGRFHGLGTGLDLLRAMGQLEAERNRVIRESIDYATLIQGAVLATSLGELRAWDLPDRHLLWRPRDQVGGDAFFARRVNRDGRNGLFLALMDCTGHGVPGAFTAMLMTSFLGHALDLACPWEPGQVLAAVNRRVKEELGQRQKPEADGHGEESHAADEGMDVTCLWLDQAKGDVLFAGARHSLWVFAPGAQDPEEIKGDRIGVGYTSTPDAQTWNSQTLHFAPGTVLVGTSDGIVDQIGGARRIAFGKRHLWEAFREKVPGTPLQTRLERAYSALEGYQGLEPRRDDVCLLAIKF